MKVSTTTAHILKKLLVETMFVNHSQSNIKINKNDNQNCQASIGNDGKCGEVRSLGILKEFHQLYENKLNQIEDDCKCKCTPSQMKIQMLHDWVRDLTEQNTLLVQVVEELEHEASERVCLLEEKLRHSSKTSFEIMKTLQEYDAQNISSQSDIIQRMMYFQSDINNLTEFIRRIRDEGNWKAEGLHFYTVAHEDLCGEVPSSARNLSKQREMEESIDKLKFELSKSKQRQDDYDRETKNKEKLIHDQTEQIEKLNDVVERCASSMPDRQRLLEELHELRAQLKIKTDDFGRLEMFDVDEQKENDEIKKQLNELEEENTILRNTIFSAHEELNILHNLIDKYNKEHQDTINTLQNKINLQLSSDNLLTIQNINNSESMSSDDDKHSENEFIKTVNLLKIDVHKIVGWSNDYKLNELKKQYFELENSLHEIKSKDQLIKNKDEMIKIQNDTLNVAQRELKELRDRIAEFEEERENRLQEIRNFQQALKLNQNTIEELEKALRNSEEKGINIQQTVDIYMETIHLLENTKHKAETEVEQQRITIRNLQDALVNVKQQFEGTQGRNATEHKEKSEIIYSLYENLSEMQIQYMDCYGEVMKLSQTADSLRDSNLDLKVVNANLQQDIEELNIKLANSKDTIQQLEENIQKLLYTNEILEGDITYMKNEMTELSNELKILQELLKMTNTVPTEERNMNLSKSLHILQEHSESLIEQLKLTQKQVTREIKLNESSSIKILELQKLLDLKTVEVQRCESEIAETKTKLNISMREIHDYESKVTSMEKQISEYQKQQDLSEQKTDEIVLNCNSDLICLKQKVDILNKILNEKSNDILKLHAELSIKADTISNLVKDNEELKDHSSKVSNNVVNLEQQLNILKIRCAEINEKYNKSKSEVEKIKQLEISMQEESQQEQHILIEKLQTSQKEENKLNNLLRELKTELGQTKLNLKEKDEELKGLASAQEEMLSLKEEINRVTKLRNRVLAENQKLQDQISKLNMSATQFENRNIIISQQLDKCLQELNTLQCAKDKLEERNIQLETEVEHLQRAFSELNQEIRYKNESVVNLEQELSETKCSRDEICAESRVVVSNVRSWLEEQKRINVALTSTVKEKNLVIEELTLERNLLLKNIKDVCERYETLSEELHMCRQYLSDMNDDQRKVLRTIVPMKRSMYTWGSQGSIPCDSPAGSPSPVFLEGGEYEYNGMYEDNESEPNPVNWMRKVQNLNDDLQKSTKYWKTKMSASSKKIKPVKDSSSVKTT